MYVCVCKTPGMRVLADVMPPSLKVGKLRREMGICHCQSWNLGWGYSMGQFHCPAILLSQGGIQRAPGLFGSLTTGSPCCTQDT